MKNNKITGGVDPQTWVTVFEQMTPAQRRWAFISAKMAEHHQTFAAIAKRHRVTAWYLGAAAQGKAPLSPKAVKALEDSLSIDLSPFLSPVEARKVTLSKPDKFGAKFEPEAETL